MARNLEAKHEKILKALLRLPDNRKCAVCDTLGPQYVVINFNTFVCTICCGLHRQFSHRCKGISMATFKPEEIRALEEGGNGVALAKYLARWNQRDAPKPTDRNPAQVREWIDLVFVKKQFYAADAQYTISVSRTQSVGSARSTASRESEFGLRLPPKASSNGAAAAQPTAGHVEAGRATSEAGSLIDLDVRQASSAQPQPSGHLLNSVAEAPAAADNSSWSAFADVSGGAQAAGPQEAGWAAFEPPADKQQSAPAALPPLQQPTAAPSGGYEGWQAFEGGGPLVPAPSAPEPAAATPQQQEPTSRSSLVMKELPSDLFSEPIPPPRMQARMPHGAVMPYGAAMAAAHAQGQPTHPGYPPPGLVAFPVAPGAAGLPQGYLPIDQQQYMAHACHSQLPQPAAGAGMPPAPSLNNSLAGAEADAFAGLIPGLRSSLPPVQPAAPSASQQQQQPQPAPYPTYNAVQQPAYGNHSMQQPQVPTQYGAYAAQAEGGFGASSGTGFQNAQAKKGGNPFA